MADEAEHGMAGATVADDLHVAIVDDDDLFRESIAQNLVDAGFAVADFPSGPGFLSYLSDGGAPGLILLDWKMPEMNGIEVLRRLRSDGCEIPVIFLTVLSDQIYEEAALTSGAVDFVEKSRSFSILRRRIELILGGQKRRGEAAAAQAEGGAPAADAGDDTLRNGEIELKIETHRAYWRGKEVPLTVTEFRMVLHMVERAGLDVRYRDLYDLVHGAGFMAGDGSEGYRSNVRTFIKRIRQKFRDLDTDFGQIENYPGFGYRWLDAEQPRSADRSAHED
ncbi:DNA-binding response regulator [Tistrella bauzanensis]|uniref:DNA-binding response regulator n=1 Tax=Tistrella bauzanensis TaxID=657419 RepID=A0ABQ1IYQ0_9PROT|nr:response regulator transcription factor [Tistrella bauzanensis]GGB54344.1 DNA-binding response regulator [Tistrella bauzanensis]